jgi:DNA replication protein DnaC
MSFRGLRVRLGADLHVSATLEIHKRRGFNRDMNLPRPVRVAYAGGMARADCPQCGGTGWRTVEIASIAHRGGVPFGSQRAPQGKREAVLCDCTEEGRDERLMAAARIPRRYQHCDFENFEADNYAGHGFGAEGETWDQSLKQARLVTQAFAREYPTGESGLLLMGPCGAGKTHLAVAALRALVERGHSGLFYDYRELLKQIQASYNPASQTAEATVLDPVLRCEVLLLDDLGAGKPSDWVLETVGHILNTRYNEKRVTLITTNYLDGPPGAGASALNGGSAPPRGARLPSGQAVPSPRMEDTLADRIGQRIRSRLYEMCRTVEIAAPDYRKEIRQAGRI